jgi:hypothetical protein
LSKIARQSANKSLPRLLAEFLIKPNQPRHVRAQLLQGPEFLARGLNQCGHPLGSDNRIRVPIKRHDHRTRILSPRIRNRLPNHLLMAQMHSVKDTNSDADPFPRPLKLVRLMDELHRAGGYEPSSPG